MAEEEKKGRNFLAMVFFSILITVAVKVFWPSLIPFSFFEFWRMDGLWVEALKRSWPIFAWCIGVTLIAKVLTRNKPEVNRNAEDILFGGTFISVFAGVVEEICFRWFIFYSAIAGFEVANWLTLGIASWIFMNITGPVADFFTLGYFHSILYGPHGWVVGAAIICSNGRFRDEHIYLGLLGWVNAWFIGMFFFYIMLTFGLPAAILVHFLYDFFIFLICYVDAAIERRLGWI